MSHLSYKQLYRCTDSLCTTLTLIHELCLNIGNLKQSRPKDEIAYRNKQFQNSFGNCAIVFQCLAQNMFSQA